MLPEASYCKLQKFCPVASDRTVRLYFFFAHKHHFSSAHKFFCEADIRTLWRPLQNTDFVIVKAICDYFDSLFRISESLIDLFAAKF